MKTKTFLYLAIFSLILIKPTVLVTATETSDNNLSKFTILPKPQKIELLPGEGLEYGMLKNVQLSNQLERPVMGAILDRLPVANKTEQNVLSLKLDDQHSPGSLEGYVLTIQDGRAEIISRGRAGLFYGCQTLEQLLEDARDSGILVPACKITDYPDMNYRAVQFDVKHHLDHMDYYYESIDRLARYKINAVIFEFEDKLGYRSHPLIGSPLSITVEEMAALTEYAKERNIEISPLVQGLGHATYILKHHEYAYLRENPNNRWAFCPLHEGTYQVLFDLYREAIEATPGSRYLHIGGDEVGHIGICPRCKPTADRDGLLNLNLYWLKRVCAFAIEHDRIPIFWDDMPLKQAGVYETTDDPDIPEAKVNEIWKKGSDKLEKVITEFPEKCVYMRWNYSKGAQPGNIKALDWYRKHDLDVMVATAVQAGPAALFPFDERRKGITSRGPVAIASFIKLANDRDIEGMLCTAWDDRSPHMETYWRGFVTSAEFSWSTNNRTLEELDKVYLKKEFGLTYDSDFADLYGQLRTSAIFWTKAFNQEGTRLDIENALLVLPGIAHFLPLSSSEGQKVEIPDFRSKLITLPDPNNPGEWSEQYSPRLSEAKDICNDYKTVQKTLTTFCQQSTRNRYHWEVFLALNRFQVTAPKLLLALEKCDTRNVSQRKDGIKLLKEALAEFDNAWSCLQSVYAKSRFIEYPDNHVPDRYFHFASQREDLTWMIQVEELLSNMIEDWLTQYNL